MSLQIAPTVAQDEQPFLEAVRRSTDLFDCWVRPPSSREEFADHIRKYSSKSHRSYLAKSTDGSLIGCVNINEIVRGGFQSAYLGYYAFEPSAGRGLMKTVMNLTISLAFRELNLHRLEANIQPENVRSIGLVQTLGFRLEGHSPRYLKINGQWRDHDRYAITSDEWLD